MALDLTRVASQVGELLTRLKSGLNERQEHLQNALDTAAEQADNTDALRRKIAAARTSWLVADLVDGLDKHYPAPPPPEEFSVLATDGSHIDVDRHRSARCFLINIGSVVLRYGPHPDAVLESRPTLYASDEDMVIRPAGGGREIPIEGGLLGVKRGVEEVCQLAELAAAQPENSSSLALVDGTLILWGLENTYPEFVSEQLISQGFLACLDKIRKQNESKQVALASYISLPRSTDVVNALRVAVCPYDPPDCDKHCPGANRDCDTLAGVRDRDLFSAMLKTGERSAVFISQSSVVGKRYGPHRVYFFYVKLEDEVARVEVPEWVAREGGLLGLTHNLVLDQCKRGHGYPVALSEAHERAVVTGLDRENFWYLVDSSLVDEHLPTSTSGKDRSKRTRWV